MPHVRPARLEVNEKQHVVGREATWRPHLRREEVHPRHGAPMRAEERPPRGGALRRGADAMGFQHLPNRTGRHAMPYLLQFALNAAVAPAFVLTGHPHNERRDGLPQARSPHAFGRVGPLPRDQPTMPPHQRIRRHQRRDRIEGPAPQGLRLRRQATALIVGQLQSPAPELLLEDAVLLDQVGNDVLLMPSPSSIGITSSGVPPVPSTCQIPSL